MKPIVDPRKGDIEDDASSTKQRSLFSIAGSLLAEISPLKLILAWTLLMGLPGLALGLIPFFLSIWIGTVSRQAAEIYTGLAPVLLLAILGLVAWFGGRPLFRMIESSFWSLNSIAVQPAYALCRETLRHLIEHRLLRRIDAPPAMIAKARAMTAAVAGLTVCILALGIAGLVWPATHWTGTLADLSAPRRVVIIALANGTLLLCAYLAIAALIWGIADATMAQPRSFTGFRPAPVDAPHWRVAHLSDIHCVGERYGFRIESGRVGPRGNEKFKATLEKLRELHAKKPLDAILITGDMTDAGISTEWAEFFDALEPFTELLAHITVLPGNHDVNVVDRNNPARMDLPTSPNKRLRQLRTLSAMEVLQGDRYRLVDRDQRRLGETLGEAMNRQRASIEAFADRASRRAWRPISDIWTASFPMIQPPSRPDGLGIIVLNSNAETHFSFTNALGMVSLEQARAMDAVKADYPEASWIVALHHHVVEYPQPAHALSERIGTALINGSWFVRRLTRFAGRAVVLHGHRHVDWIGESGGLPIISAPSPVMEGTNADDSYFYIHTLHVDGKGLALARPERIVVPAPHPAIVQPLTQG
ncbi:metallophosphoesterase family protein [Kaistia terrae]|uniref:Metallophosphoesterase family protein n=1 Tax=Kaistia terrae TaxID=537017 RepID=A0ABW0PW37_9HYPH|nr:metallophosphoesterase [Kaistia terrae]MCX5577275.1 metallophosphoesterase [Kaistia terrae]